MALVYGNKLDDLDAVAQIDFGVGEVLAVPESLILKAADASRARG